MATFENIYTTEDGLTLFRWSGATGGSIIFGLLSDTASALKSELTLQEFWETHAPSALMIAPSEPDHDHLSGWARYIGYSAQSQANIIAWLGAPSASPPPPDPDYRSLEVDYKTNQLNVQSGFNLSALQVSISGLGGNPASVDWDYENAVLSLKDAVFYGWRIETTKSQTTLALDALSLRLNGDQAGALVGNLVQQDLHALFGLLGDQPTPLRLRSIPEIRYFYSSGKLSFPMAEPIDVGKGNILTATVSLNPALPFSPSQTFFEPDLSQQAMKDLFTCNTVAQTNGNPATLIPAEGFGFHLARTPNSYQGWRQFYMAPFGPMTVTTPGTTPRVIKLMCGLSGHEYLQLNEGDMLNLVPSQNAYANHFIPPSTQPGDNPIISSGTESDLLSNLGQTSWLSIKPTSPAGYYSQADVEPFFASGVLPNAPYPSAVSSYLGDPSNAAGTTPAFPFAAHFGVYDQSNSNKDVTPDFFTAFESQVLVHQRYQTLVHDQATPVFTDHGGNALAGSAATTPTGFIAGLNTESQMTTGRKKRVARDAEPATAAGTWKSLTIAAVTDNKLAFGSGVGGTVYPPLIQGLLHSKVFLVANDWAHLAVDPAHSELVVDGFAFHLPLSSGTSSKTIAIFKFQTTASLAELVETPNVWFRTHDFILGGPQGVTNMQAAINGAIQEAKDSEYVYFRDTIASDPMWTGVVFLQVPVDGGSMPPDLQILYAGLDGELYAHHFGIDLNQLTTNKTDGSAVIQQSSLFGVIHYQGTPPSDATKLAFTLLDLQVEIKNSVVTDFDALVGMTIPGLFDRQVSFTDPDFQRFGPKSQIKGTKGTWIPGPVNTLVIKGVYQRQGNTQNSVGTVSFQRSDPLSISTVKDGQLARVVDEFQVKTAVLSPSYVQYRITGISTDNPTVVTSTTHGLSTGDTISIMGTDSTPSIDGQQTVTVLTPNTFTVAVEVTKEGRKGTWNKGTKIQGRFSLGGQLCFSSNPFSVDNPADLFSFGVPPPDPITGLDIDDLGFTISFVLDMDGKRVGDTTIDIDYSRIQVSPSKEGIRDRSLLASFPLKVTRFLYAENGLTSSSLAASPMNVVNFRGHDDAKPNFALECDLPLGSLGFLAGAHADLSSKLVLAWGPSSATPDNDAAKVMVSLLNLSADVEGFNLQGIMQVGFKDANLIHVPKTMGSSITSISVADPAVITSSAHGLSTGDTVVITGSDSTPTIDGQQIVTVLTRDTFTVEVEVAKEGTKGTWNKGGSDNVYVALFNNIAIKILGMSFPPNVLANFLLMAGDNENDPAHQNIAWYLAAAQSS